MKLNFKTLCAIGSLLLCSNNALAMPDNSRNQSSRNNMANVDSYNNIKQLYDYCGKKKINLDKSNFFYVMKDGYVKCIVTINGVSYDKDLYYERKRIAKDEISGYVLEELIKLDGDPQTTERKDYIKLLYEYCRDRGIDLPDSNFGYEHDREAYVKCILTLDGVKYDKNSYYNSPKAAKNATAEYVLEKLKEKDEKSSSTDDATSKKEQDEGTILKIFDVPEETTIPVNEEERKALNLGEAQKIVNEKDGEGNTPLHRACIEGNAELVDYLINLGADIYMKNKKGKTPLRAAIIKDKHEIVRVLIPKYGEKELYKALRCAVKNNSENCTNILISDVDFSREQLKKALMLSVVDFSREQLEKALMLSVKSNARQ